MLKYVDWNGVNTVVELGGGTGVMSRAILSRKDQSTELTICEIEQDRYEGLKQYQNDNTKVIHIDATSCLNKFQEGSIDIVISTLPLGSLDIVSTREILGAIHSRLKPEGLFIQYQYFASNKEDIEKLFIITKSDWEPLNLPPAFIYVCKKR